VPVHVKQLLVKGTLQRAEEQAAEPPPHSVGCDLLDALRDEMLAECRRLVRELMREAQER
jgi:hypothetical protein